MPMPTIHINGTSPKVLLEDLLNAMNILQAARTAVMATAPHARDYHRQGNTVFVEAHKEHVNRLKRLEDVHAELYSIALHVARKGE